MMKGCFCWKYAFIPILLPLLAIAPSDAQQFGPPSWAGSTLRGRYHYYNGPHVNFGRGRWGGGISNNGALVLNNLVSTAGVVIPQILPMLLENSQLTRPGNSSGDSEHSPASVPVDPNHDQRSKRLTEVEDRTKKILELLKIPEPPSLSTSITDPFLDVSRPANAPTQIGQAP
jgi:hypothetical protein